MINSLLNSHKAKTISLYKRTESVTNGIVGEPTFTLYKTVQGLYWKASGSKSNISDKFKEQVTASVIVSPSALAETDLENSMKITVSGEGDYMLVYGDDIGGQGRVLQLNLKEWT